MATSQPTKHDLAEEVNFLLSIFIVRYNVGIISLVTLQISQIPTPIIMSFWTEILKKSEVKISWIVTMNLVFFKAANMFEA
jgi:hypothetical protein